MPDDDDTGRRPRTYDVALLEDIEAARRKISIDHRIRDLEVRQGEMFGADGHGGRFASVEAMVRVHDTKIDTLEVLRWKLMGMMTLGGIIAGFVAWLIGSARG